ncbi:hypothetical protein [Pelagibacterium luteolum]|uniref:Uncharacterized protein n=1 Tax=Pelagibacterium luteolum TaxID=440168 RepID=A0A1G7TJE3_9HYPH|nr:hypothetical protein [Pelagibacterium luteolum]SDG35463.1 hypothetical protein SAMN04487974_102168 [Pelagibacterium luteolum]
MTALCLDHFNDRAKDLADAGDIIRLESLLDEAVAARIEQRADAPTTPQFNRAARLLDQLKRKAA